MEAENLHDEWRFWAKSNAKTRASSLNAGKESSQTIFDRMDKMDTIGIRNIRSFCQNLRDCHCAVK